MSVSTRDAPAQIDDTCGPTLAPAVTSRSAARLGFWSALFTAILSAGWSVALVYQQAVAPLPKWHGGAAFAHSYKAVQFLSVYPSLLLAMAFVVMMVSLHYCAPEEKRVWSMVGVAFGIIYAVLASANYLIQLAAIKPSLQRGETEGIALLVTTVASVISLLVPDVFHDPAMTEGNFRGAMLVMLAIALPAMAISMIQAARGSVRAQIVWLAMLSYVLYYAVALCFDATFNRLYPLYVAMLSLGLASIVALVVSIHVDHLRVEGTRRGPVRLGAIYLLVITLVFILAEARDIIPALVKDTAPASLDGSVMLTNPFQLMNEAILCPLIALALVWLWWQRSRGYFLVGVFLVFWTIEAISNAVDQVFGHISDPTQSTSIIPFMAGLGLVTLVPTVLYLRNLCQSPQDAQVEQDLKSQ